MKKRVLSIILISALSISLLVGCGNNTDNNDSQNSNQQQDQQEQPEQENPQPEDDKKEDEVSSDDKDEDVNEVIEEVTEEKIEAKFTEIIDYLYNRDYSNEEQSIEAENYIKENFTPEGAENMINKIVSYNEKVSYSDLLITLVKNIENTDDRYESMYKIRYNMSLAIGKPSIYSDVIAKVVVDKDGKILIESINDSEF